jgi:hypothetical protein
MINSILDLPKRIWEIEVMKYQQKGWKNFMIGLVLISLYFWFLPNFI